MYADFKIFHPHNLEVVEALLDDVEIIDNSKFIIKVLEEINYIQEINEPDMVILLPDGGAYKWGVKLCDKINFSGDVIAAAKNRKFVDGKSILTQQLPDYDFKGKDVIIIDDICIYGGTFKGLSKLLKERNCSKLYLAVSHMTVQNLGEDPTTNYFDKVFTTNSKHNNYIYKTMDKNHGLLNTLSQPQNLKIINLF
jgi:ribose-phosphate pyrophosphokinase